jgi:hypothetical protein
MKMKKVYINRENEGEILCPNCKKTKFINVSNHRIPKRPLRLRCHCGHSFTILIEYRKHHRKNVNIPGKLFLKQNNTEICNIIITSLSVVGIGFEVKSINTIKINDVYEISFTLDDKLDSMIQEEIIVKRIEGNFIGAEFSDQDKYSYELDFYILKQLSVP